MQMGCPKNRLVTTEGHGSELGSSGEFVRSGGLRPGFPRGRRWVEARVPKRQKEEDVNHGIKLSCRVPGKSKRRIHYKLP